MEQEEKSTSQIERYIKFKLGKESFAIKLLDIKEVIPVPELTPLPGSPAYYQGIMNLRGQIISIIDLRKKLNVVSEDGPNEEAVIIIELEGVAIGLVVDEIFSVLNIEVDSVKEVPVIKSQVNAQYISGVIHHDEELVVLFNLEKVINLSEILKYRNKAAQRENYEKLKSTKENDFYDADSNADIGVLWR